jgi:hypothetical protein
MTKQPNRTNAIVQSFPDFEDCFANIPDVLPIATQGEVSSAVKEELDKFWARCPCIPAFTESNSAAISRCDGRVNTNSGRAENYSACFTEGPQSTCTPITSLGELCSVCHRIHDDRIAWIAILRRASDRLTDSDLARYITHSLEFSHLCRNAWCINVAHIVVEDHPTNVTRRFCQLDRVNGKIDIADCEHDPPCIDTTKTSLKDLNTLIAELKEHQVSLKDTPASICPFEDCPERYGHASQHAMILHLCNEHSPGPIPPIVPDELSWECPKCEARMVTGKRIKAHVGKTANGVSCAAARQVGRGKGLDAKERGRVGEGSR